MVSIEIAPSELRNQHLRENLTFLDRQRLLQPSVNTQIEFDFQGLRQSYKNDPRHPESRFVAQFSRIWIYDAALNIYADLKAGRFRLAGYQVGRVMQLALQEEARGYEGLWHFSYNTQEDSFIDPRGPAGSNAWCLSAVYAYLLATGETSALEWANRTVQRYLFRLQVMDPAHPLCGLIQAGLYNPDDLELCDNMGYHVYERNANQPYEHAILEHNIDVAGTYRLAFRAIRRFAPHQAPLLKELIRRHDLLMQGIRRCFWQKDHFVSALNGKGHFFLGIDGQPSVAVDNNTWAAHVFLPYDPELALQSLQYVMNRFVIRTPVAEVQDLPNRVEAEFSDLEGVYYFPAAFSDPFVQVPLEHRPKLERLFQLEAAFGLVLFLHDLAQTVGDPDLKRRLAARAEELYRRTVTLQRLYGPCAAPYASANVPAFFSTLDCVTTATTAVVAASVLSGVPNEDFIGVAPPAEFVVNGRPPLKSCL